jgi:hypothetical protein
VQVATDSIHGHDFSLVTQTGWRLMDISKRR